MVSIDPSVSSACLTRELAVDSGAVEVAGEQAVPLAATLTRERGQEARRVASPLQLPTQGPTSEMAELIENNDGFVIALSRWEHFGALKRKDIVVPLTSLVRARWSSNLRNEVRGTRIPGTSIPRRLQLGTWRHGNDKDFVAIHRDEPGYVIDLVDHPFVRLVVSTGRRIDLIDDPETR